MSPEELELHAEALEASHTATVARLQAELSIQASQVHNQAARLRALASELRMVRERDAAPPAPVVPQPEAPRPPRSADGVHFTWRELLVVLGLKRKQTIWDRMAAGTLSRPVLENPTRWLISDIEADLRQHNTPRERLTA